MIISNGQRVYRTIHTRLNTLWKFPASKRQGQHLNTLTGFICGIIQSKELKLADVAGEIPRAGREESHIMQLRRWLKNENISADLYYLPFTIPSPKIENKKHNKEAAVKLKYAIPNTFANFNPSHESKQVNHASPTPLCPCWASAARYYSRKQP